MYIRITTGQVTQEQGVAVEKFLASFVTRLKKQPSVVAIYHNARPEKGEESTVIIWRDQESLAAYRTGELIKEAIAFEKKLGLKSTREVHPLIYEY
jgi:quinol monooxygenase YgiN